MEPKEPGRGPLGAWTQWSCLAEPQIHRIRAPGELYPGKEPGTRQGHCLQGPSWWKRQIWPCGLLGLHPSVPPPSPPTSSCQLTRQDSLRPSSAPAPPPVLEDSTLSPSVLPVRAITRSSLGTIPCTRRVCSVAPDGLLCPLQGKSGSANRDILGAGMRRSGGLITGCHRAFSASLHHAVGTASPQLDEAVTVPHVPPRGSLGTLGADGHSKGTGVPWGTGPPRCAQPGDAACPVGGASSGTALCDGARLGSG